VDIKARFKHEISQQSLEIQPAAGKLTANQPAAGSLTVNELIEPTSSADSQPSLPSQQAVSSQLAAASKLTEGSQRPRPRAQAKLAASSQQQAKLAASSQLPNRPAKPARKQPTASHNLNEALRPPFQAGKPKYMPSKLNYQEDKLIESIDELAIFEQLQKTLLPQLKGLVNSGASHEEILEAGKTAAVTRLVLMASSQEANLSAIKEVLDRTLGKVAEKKSIEHRLAKLPDSDLDALLLTSISDEDSID
jgi:hypothetical protein